MSLEMDVQWKQGLSKHTRSYDPEKSFFSSYRVFIFG